MSDLDGFATQSAGERVSVQIDGTHGTGVSKVYVGDAVDTLWHDDLLLGWKLDPTQWEIVGPLRVNRWVQNAATDTWCYQYRANVQARAANLDDLEPLLNVKVTVRRDLHLTPAWSWLSGVAFQKKRMNCTHR